MSDNKSIVFRNDQILIYYILYTTVYTAYTVYLHTVYTRTTYIYILYMLSDLAPYQWLIAVHNAQRDFVCYTNSLSIVLWVQWETNISKLAKQFRHIKKGDHRELNCVKHCRQEKGWRCIFNLDEITNVFTFGGERIILLDSGWDGTVLVKNSWSQQSRALFTLYSSFFYL